MIKLLARLGMMSLLLSGCLNGGGEEDSSKTEVTQEAVKGSEELLAETLRPFLWFDANYGTLGATKEIELNSDAKVVYWEDRMIGYRAGQAFSDYNKFLPNLKVSAERKSSLFFDSKAVLGGGTYTVERNHYLNVWKADRTNFQKADFSVVVCLKPSVTGNAPAPDIFKNYQILTKFIPAINSNYNIPKNGMGLRIAYNKEIEFFIGDDQGNALELNTNNNTVVFGNLYCILASYDPHGYMEIHVNGARKAIIQVPVIMGDVSPGAHLQMGSGMNAWGFNGDIYDIQFYDRALNASDRDFLWSYYEKRLGLKLDKAESKGNFTLW